MTVRVGDPPDGDAAGVPDGSVTLVVLVRRLPVAVVVQVGSTDHVGRHVLVGIRVLAATLAFLVKLVQTVGREELDLLGVDRVRPGETQGLVGAELLV